ncbi:MAG: GNAT family N-acetyltransferase, partial [Hyphomicrobiales bacterium]
CEMDIVPARSAKQVTEAANLMCALVQANKALYADDLVTVEDYYRGSWFFSDAPVVPAHFLPPNGDVLVAYLNGAAAGTVATYRMRDDICELKSMFVSPDHRRKGVAVALCGAVISLARSQGFEFVRLSTGLRQPEARRLYQAMGFRMVPPWISDPPEGYDYFELKLQSA